MKPERNTEPVDGLGQLADLMLRELRLHDESARCVVFLENDLRCMTALDGWDSDTDAVAAVFAHMAAVFEANGKKLMVVPLGQG